MPGWARVTRHGAGRQEGNRFMGLYKGKITRVTTLRRPQPLYGDGTLRMGNLWGQPSLDAWDI